MKFYGAIVLSFIVPVGAYVYQTVEHDGPVQVLGLFLACAVGYVASQAIHFVTSGKAKADALAQATLQPGTPVRIAGSRKHVTITKV